MDARIGGHPAHPYSRSQLARILDRVTVEWNRRRPYEAQRILAQYGLADQWPHYMAAARRTGNLPVRTVTRRTV